MCTPVLLAPTQTCARVPATASHLPHLENEVCNPCASGVLRGQKGGFCAKCSRLPAHGSGPCMLAICYNLGCVSAGLSGQFILDSQGGNCSPACAIRADKDWARSQEEGNTQPLGQGLLNAPPGCFPGGSQPRGVPMPSAESWAGGKKEACFGLGGQASSLAPQWDSGHQFLICELGLGTYSIPVSGL